MGRASIPCRRRACESLIAFRESPTITGITGEALLLAPSQAYFLRENLKLRLLSARLALLQQPEAATRVEALFDAQGRLEKRPKGREAATEPTCECAIGSPPSVAAGYLSAPAARLSLTPQD